MNVTTKTTEELCPFDDSIAGVFDGSYEANAPKGKTAVLYRKEVKRRLMKESIDETKTHIIDQYLEKDSANGHRKIKELSHRELCKILKAAEHVGKTKDGKVRCQAITADGTRCERASSQYSSYDLTTKNYSGSIPSFLKRKLTTRQYLKLKAFSHSNACCFYCWQHSALVIAELGTWSSNWLYYTTHPLDILRIFFEDVEMSGRTLKLGRRKTVEEIVKGTITEYGTSQGAASLVKWGLVLLVFSYDSIKPYITKFISEVELEKITTTSAKVLLKGDESTVVN